MLVQLYVGSHNFSDEEITKRLFKSANQLVEADPSTGHYMGVCLQYHGDVAINQATNALSKVKEEESVNFVDWCPTGFKIGKSNASFRNIYGFDGLNGGTITKSVTMLYNNTAIKGLFEHLEQAFIAVDETIKEQYYIDGGIVNKNVFQEAKEYLTGLCLDYDTVGGVGDEEYGDDYDEL